MLYLILIFFFIALNNNIYCIFFTKPIILKGSNFISRSLFSVSSIFPTLRNPSNDSLKKKQDSLILFKTLKLSLCLSTLSKRTSTPNDILFNGPLKSWNKHLIYVVISFDISIDWVIFGVIFFLLNILFTKSVILHIVVLSS